MQLYPGSVADVFKYNPWRAPGNAPVFDPCGRAGGASHPTPGHGEFTNTTYASFGDLGSKVLPKYPTGIVWTAGSEVETMQSIRANHGGGYQYRRAFPPSPQPLTTNRRCLSCQLTWGGVCAAGQALPAPLGADRGVLPRDPDALRRRLEHHDVRPRDAPRLRPIAP